MDLVCLERHSCCLNLFQLLSMLGFQTNTGTKSHKHTCLKYPKTDSGMISIYIIIYNYYIIIGQHLWILGMLLVLLMKLNSSGAWSSICTTLGGSRWSDSGCGRFQQRWLLGMSVWVKFCFAIVEPLFWNEFDICLFDWLSLVYRKPKNGRAVKSSGNMLKSVEIFRRKNCFLLIESTGPVVLWEVLSWAILQWPWRRGSMAVHC